MPGTTPASASFATSLARSLNPEAGKAPNSALERLLLQHGKMRHARLMSQKTDACGEVQPVKPGL